MRFVVSAVILCLLLCVRGHCRYLGDGAADRRESLHVSHSASLLLVAVSLGISKCNAEAKRASGEQCLSSLTPIFAI